MRNKDNSNTSSRVLLPRLVDACPDAIIGIDKKGTVMIFNPAAATLTGYPINEALGKMHITDFYGSAEVARSVKAAIYSPRYGGENRLDGYETEILDHSGSHIPIRLSAALLIDEGREIGSIGFFHDLTRQKKLEEKLKMLSITDGLTGLYNQRHFHESLSREMARAKRHKRNLSLIGFDLDEFKQCNDRLGHLEGDNTLRLVGDILKTQTRKSDLSFRYGGDEFFIILPETNQAQAFEVAEKIRRTFNERWPFDSLIPKEQPFRVTLSIGVVEYGGEEDPKELIKKLDILIYSAKRTGGDRIASPG